MARTRKSGDATSSAAASPRSSEVKMAKRHKEYIEADVEATQAAQEEQRTSGPNPFPEKTARWSAWENRKRQEKGLPPTNAINE
jgi:hypothetical protein